MADELVLYTNPMSRGRIARWMLEEVGHPYRAEILEFASMNAPEYLAINPMGKVPAVRHGDTIVTEAAAICAYLADVFPEAGLAPPPGSRLRGPYYRWLFFGAGPIEAANTNKALKIVVPAERTMMVGYGTQERVLQIDKRPAFERYWALVGSRQAARRAREIDEELAAARRKAS